MVKVNSSFNKGKFSKKNSNENKKENTLRIIGIKSIERRTFPYTSKSYFIPHSILSISTYGSKCVQPHENGRGILWLPSGLNQVIPLS